MSISSGDVLQCRVTLRNPFRIEKLSWFSRLHRAAFRPRRRMSKRLVGRPAKKLFRFIFNLAWARGSSAFAVRVGEHWRSVSFSPHNTQFGALYMPQNRPVYEPETSAVLDILVGADDVFYDIGANWGYYAVLLASRPDHHGRIEAFEPFPPTFDDLTRTVAQTGLADRIGVHGMALSDRDGTASMAAWDGIQSGLARLGAAENSAAGRTEVPLGRLDSLRLPDPDVIKIDAEDHEEEVLAGAAALLARARPIIVFENWLHREAPRVTLGPLTILADHGYRFFVIGWQTDGEEPCLVADLPYPEATEATLVLVPFLPENRFFMPPQLNILAVGEDKMDILRRRFRAPHKP